jgi:hypothetical protein
VQAFDLYSSRPRSTDDSQVITGLVIDSNPVMQFVQSGSALIERADQNGRWLTPLALLSEPPSHGYSRSVPRLAVSPISHLVHVSDPVDSSIRRVYNSPSGQATFTGWYRGGALLHDPINGDLIVPSRYGVLAQRVSAREWLVVTGVHTACTTARHHRLS